MKVCTTDRVATRHARERNTHTDCGYSMPSGPLLGMLPSAPPTYLNCRCILWGGLFVCVCILPCLWVPRPNEFALRCLDGVAWMLLLRQSWVRQFTWARSAWMLVCRETCTNTSARLCMFAHTPYCTCTSRDQAVSEAFAPTRASFRSAAERCHRRRGGHTWRHRRRAT